jgi:putative two-component system response regulator
MAVADVYDALISVRPYRRAYSHAEAIELMKEERGKHFDPDVLDAFLRIEGEFRVIAERFRDELDEDLTSSLNL